MNLNKVVRLQFQFKEVEKRKFQHNLIPLYLLIQDIKLSNNHKKIKNRLYL